MNLLMLNAALALVWAAITGNFSLGNLIAGFALGYLTLLALRRAFGPSSYFAKVQQVLGFTGFFVWDLLRANFRVAYYVLNPRLSMQPRVVEVPLETCSELEITLLANVISLTPGTLTLDVSKDRCYLYIHFMNAPDADAARREIKTGFERLVLGVLRGLPPSEEPGEPPGSSQPARDPSSGGSPTSQTEGSSR
jgi:multicomponent Na+:H+ antiporter subunit E